MWANRDQGFVLRAAHRQLEVMVCCIVLAGVAHGDDDRAAATAPMQVNCLEFSPDGEWLAAAGGNSGEGGQLMVWSTEDWQPRALLREPETMTALSFSRDGRRIAIDGGMSTVSVIGIPEFEEIERWSTDQTDVRSVCWSPDGRILVTGGRDGSIKSWEFATQQQVLSLSIHDQPDAEADGSVDTLAISPNGRFLASGGWRETARVWDLMTRQQQHAFRVTDYLVLAVAFSPDGMHFASASRQELELWIRETETGLVRAKVRTGCDDVAFHPTGDFVVAAGWGAAAQVFRLNLTLPDDALFEHIEELIEQFEDDDVRVRESASAAIVDIGLPAEPQLFDAIRAPGVETRIRSRRLWNQVRSPAPVAEPGGHPDEMSEVCFSPNGALLATGCRGGVVKIWNVDDWSEAAVLHQFVVATPQRVSPP